MERDEELQQAAEAYASQMCNDCSATLYCNCKNKKCIERCEHEKVFADGAKWADEHPKNVWHSAGEEPNDGTHILMEYKFLNTKEFKSYNKNSEGLVNWDILKKYYGISRWAYVSDLLPKGGKE